MSAALAPRPASLQFVKERFPDAACEPLQQEASSRRYWRLRGANLVLMERPDTFLPRRDPYCRATELFEDCGVEVPRIVETVGAKGLILLEDGGDVLLSDRVRTTDPGTLRDLYAPAVRILRRLRRGTSLLSPLMPAARETLGPRRLGWELRFFHKHWIRGMRKAPLTAAEDEALHDFYRSLCHRLWRDRPPVLCHRDYHSRNLLVASDGAIVVTDHQDAQWGPALYDLASLLRDPYVTLPEDLEEEVLTMWVQDVARWRLDELRSAYERTALQRNLKAAGTFAWQVGEFGREKFRKSLAPTLAHAARAFDRLPEYSQARSILDRHRLLAVED